MKKCIYFFLLFCAFTAHATDITVPVGEKIATYANQANAGDRLILLQGTYDNQDYVTLKPGVHVKGAGKELTIVKIKQWAWYNGLFTIKANPGTTGNNEISDMALDGQNVSWSAIHMEEISSFKVHDIIIRNFFRSGIELYGNKSATPVQNVEIYNFLIENSSNENNASANGNIQAYGFFSNILIHDGKVVHTGASALDDSLIPNDAKGFYRAGYAIKFQETYDAANNYASVTGKIINSKFYKITMAAKAASKFNGGNSPTINFEFFNVESDNNEVADCDFTSSLSLEKENRKKPSVSFYVRRNRFRIIKGVSSALEIALSNVIIEDNEFNWLANKVTGVWGAGGQYNGKTTLLTGQHIRKNTFLFYNQNPIMFRYDSAIDDWIFENNTIIGGRPAVLGFQGNASGGSKTVTIQNNKFQYTFTPVGYENTNASVSKPKTIILKNNSINVSGLSAP